MTRQKIEIEILRASLESTEDSLQKAKNKFDKAKIDATSKFKAQKKEIEELTTASQAWRSNADIEEDRIKKAVDKAVAPLEEKIKTLQSDHEEARLADQAVHQKIAEENHELKEELRRARTELESWTKKKGKQYGKGNKKGDGHDDLGGNDAGLGAA